MDGFQVVANAVRMHLGGLLDRLCGCSHRRTTFPMTFRARVNGQRSTHAETYIVCVECGRQFAYDWTTMQVTSQHAARAAAGRFEAAERTGVPGLAVNGFPIAAGAGRK